MAVDNRRVLPANDARQAMPGLGVRYVLLISTAAAALLMALVYIAFMP
jgi:hypothetical protein